MSRTRAGRTLAAAAATALLLAAAPAAQATQSTISGKISPNKGKPGTPLALTIGFTITRENGENNTLRKVVLDFPPNAVANGAKFPSCMPAAINARRSFNSCPKGSLIGRGSLVADVPATDVYNVPGKVTLFNGAGGKSITVHIYAENPVLISQAFTAPLRKTSGRYGYKLTADIPYELQEISDGWFAEVKRFTTTVDAKWRGRGYIEAKRCPKGGRAPIAGAFDFLREAAPTSALGFVTCKP
jgi:hypothetical protein